MLRAWAAWTHGLAEEVTTSLRLLSLPPLPELPEFLRGRQLVVIDGVVLTDDEQASRLLAPLRALAPEMDTFARVPATAVTRIHLDPEGPTPGISDHLLLDDFDEEAAAALVSSAGPGVRHHAAQRGSATPRRCTRPTRSCRRRH